MGAKIKQKFQNINFYLKKCMYLHLRRKIRDSFLVIYTKNKPRSDYVQKLKTKISTKNCENYIYNYMWYKIVKL